MDSGLQTVSTWVGLFSGITGIILSVVAIAFAVLVQKDSNRVNEQARASLTKIEFTIERLSADTTGLIKAAWDKMLVSNDDRPPNFDASNIESDSIAQGLTAELQGEILRNRQKRLDAGEAVTREEIDSIKEALANFSQTIEAQLQAVANHRGLSDRVTAAQASLLTVGSVATELIRELGQEHRGHLSANQYHKLLESPIGAALKKLRNIGLIVPMAGRVLDEDNKGFKSKDPVYWLPPGSAESVRPALLMIPKDDSAAEKVREELAKIEYPPART
ncbi:hypothetical protein [Nonomuraea sp. NPDC050202]|uniref:hypothetical protein n=1 Tax=Nonomuraea sp. NPDC050202 TaxID=3155035 RepID=UPI0034037CBC